MSDKFERNRIAEEAVTQKIKNLEDQIVHGLAALEQRVARLENSPGAQGANLLQRTSERVDQLESILVNDESDDIIVATAGDLEALATQIQLSSDTNYAAAPAVAGLDKRIADLESRVSKAEEAAKKTAKETPKTS